MVENKRFNKVYGGPPIKLVHLRTSLMEDPYLTTSLRTLHWRKRKRVPVKERVTI